MTKSALEISELVYLSSVCVLTLTGNCLVIMAFIFGPRTIRTYTNYFVVNLAVSDLMVGCLSLPFWMVYRGDRLLISGQLYKCFIALDILCGTTSILSLAAISLERLFAVKFPTTHFNLTAKPVICGIVATWTIGIIFTSFNIAITNKQDVRVYTATIFVLIFLLPLFVILMSYLIIFLTALRMLKASSNQTSKLARELHVAKTISVIIGLFIFCWMPFFILNMVYMFCGNFCSQLRKYVWLAYLTKMMHYSNSMMNFFVYAVRSPEFRRTFQAIVFKCDTSAFRERVRTFSESIVTRSRSASERFSFIHSDNNNGNRTPNGLRTTPNGTAATTPDEEQIRLMKNRLNFKQTRLSYHSNCTDISAIDDTWSPSVGSTNSNNPLLSHCSSSHHVSFDDDRMFNDSLTNNITAI